MDEREADFLFKGLKMLGSKSPQNVLEEWLDDVVMLDAECVELETILELFTDWFGPEVVTWLAEKVPDLAISVHIPAGGKRQKRLVEIDVEEVAFEAWKMNRKQSISR